MAEKDSQDAFWGCIPKKKSKDKKNKEPKSANTVLSGFPEDEEYPMTYKKIGKCIIFNHTEFTCNLDPRPDSQKDVEALKTFFEAYKFDVDVYHDRKKQEVDFILMDAGAEIYEDTCCFVCCVLTHGTCLGRDKQEVLYAKDTYYPTENLFTPFSGERCTSLAGKPKIFFIQACRGRGSDPGVNVIFTTGDWLGSFLNGLSQGVLNQLYSGNITVDEASLNCRIPVKADFLVAYSTVKDYVAFKRNGEGSWFIQSLCKVLTDRAKDLDLLSILTIVNQKVAYDYESTVELDKELNKKKQIPCVYSTLTRRIFFSSYEKSQKFIPDEESSSENDHS